MGSSNARRAAALMLILGAAPGCEALVHPDDSRLNPPGSDGSVLPDGGVDVATDVPTRSDVPTATDVPNRDDRVTPTDAPARDVIDDVPATDAPPACPASCDDGVACTHDSCTAATGQCAHMPDDTVCPASTPFCDPVAGCSMRPCRSNAECDDHDACNGVETCSAGGQCASGTPPTCDDGFFCNGAETCDPRNGCSAGPPPDCADTTDCTTDQCDDSIGACVHDSVDADGDGFAAARVGTTTCAGGTDCDDADPTVNPAAAEICGNGIDDNCSGAVDEGCNQPPTNDACSGARAVMLVNGQASVRGTTLNAMNGPQSACGGSGGDVWYTVTYPGTKTLRVEALPDADPTDPVVVLRTGCTTQDIVCNDDYSSSSTGSRAWLRPDPMTTGTRTVYIIVDSYQPGSEGSFTLNVSTMDDAEMDTCSSSQPFDVSEGGTVLDYTFQRTGVQRGSCGGDGGEDMYIYNGPAGRVRVTAFTAAARQLTTYVREGGCLPFTYNELGCQNGNPADLRVDASGNTGGTQIFVDGFATGINSYGVRVIVP